jgi:hypothetical protein
MAISYLSCALCMARLGASSDAEAQESRLREDYAIQRATLASAARYKHGYMLAAMDTHCRHARDVHKEVAQLLMDGWGWHDSLVAWCVGQQHHYHGKDLGAERE